MERKARIIQAKQFIDDRGVLTFCNDFSFDHVERFYMVENHDANYVRAWHGHEREGKYVHVVSGTALVGVVPLGEVHTYSPDKFVLSSRDPKMLYIPPGNYNGFQNLEKDTRIMFYSTSTIKESMGDDIRKEWDYWNIWGKDYR